MHSHNEKDQKEEKYRKAYQFLDNHLPLRYTELTQKILVRAKITVSDDVIRNVRNNRRTSNVAVLNALLKVAKSHQKKKQELEKTLQD